MIFVANDNRKLTTCTGTIRAGGHIVVACDEASIKVLAMIGKSASYST